MLHIENNQPISASQFIAVLDASGIHRPTEDRARMQRMLNNANVLLTAWDDHQLIGVLRGVSDKSYCTFVSELAVIKSHLHTIQGPNISIMLLSAPAAMQFYPKVDFRPVPTAFKVQRQF